MTDVDIAAAVQGHVERNRELVRGILDLGIDLSEERAVDLHFLAPSKRSADTLVVALPGLGYEQAELDKASLFSRARSVTVRAKMSVNRVIDPAHVEILVRAAAQAGAIHDGWGMPVTPPS